MSTPDTSTDAVAAAIVALDGPARVLWDVAYARGEQAGRDEANRERTLTSLRGLVDLAGELTALAIACTRRGEQQTAAHVIALACTTLGRTPGLAGHPVIALADRAAGRPRHLLGFGTAAELEDLETLRGELHKLIKHHGGYLRRSDVDPAWASRPGTGRAR